MQGTCQLAARRLLLTYHQQRQTRMARHLVTEAWQCREAWQERLAAPVFAKIRMAEYFVELDKKFTNEYRGSAVDIDIFANNVTTEAEAEQMEELLHKLRRTPSTVHTPPSTHHAAVRAMLQHGETRNLVRMLEDRHNYGIFLDYHSSVLVLDHLLEAGELAAGSRVTAQLMLQEEDYPLASALGNLCCWRYLQSGRSEAWYYPGEVEEDPNPEEVIRVRVKMVPNNYHDEHFDLREPDHILGKTLAYLNPNTTHPASRTLAVAGNILWGKPEDAISLLQSGAIAAEAVPLLVSLLPEGDSSSDLRNGLETASTEEVVVGDQLAASCKRVAGEVEAGWVEGLQTLYRQWNRERDAELMRQYETMQREARVEAINQTKLDLAKTEEKLFFFDNYDRYQMEKEEKVQAWARTLPSTDWNMPTMPLRKYFKKTDKDSERKVPRWERREQKKGPPK